MAEFKAFKVVAALPPQLIANTVYLVRSGVGFDLYATNSVGTVVAYGINRLPTLKKTSANVTNNSNTTLVTVSDLDIPVIAGRSYEFHYCLRISSTSTNIGIAAQLICPAGILTAMSERQSGGDGTSGIFGGSMTASGDIVANSASRQANAIDTMIINGMFHCTTTGTLQLQFRMEPGFLGSGTITVGANSSVVFTEYG